MPITRDQSFSTVGLGSPLFRPHGLAPMATAFVMAPEVEGSQFMPALLVQSFEAAGWPACRVFTTAEEAEAWVQGLLAAAPPR